MTSILFGIVWICCSQFECNYNKNGTPSPDFLFQIWNLHQILSTLKRKMIVITNMFLKLRTLKGLFKPLSEKLCFRTSSDSQHVKGFQTPCITALLSYFLTTLRGNDLENISLIEIWNLTGVCQQIDWWWQVSCSELAEFAVPDSNEIMLKAKVFFSIFSSCFKSPLNFKHFEKEDDRDS